jgi:glycosyltransferase involved in cell wall biosynthesis
MERLSGYSLTIAGEAHEREYFRSSVLPAVTRLRQAGVQVELLDRFTPEEEVPALFARHGAVMLPYTQGFVAQSGVIFMALAHEIPVVASEAGGMRELFAQFRVGETFAQETPAALAEAVSRLHAGGSGAGLIEQIRAAKRRFSWDQAARATLAGYDKVMDAVATQGRRQTDDRAVEATVAF